MFTDILQTYMRVRFLEKKEAIKRLEFSASRPPGVSGDKSSNSTFSASVPVTKTKQEGILLFTLWADNTG